VPKLFTCTDSNSTSNLIKLLPKYASYLLYSVTVTSMPVCRLLYTQMTAHQLKISTSQHIFIVLLCKSTVQNTSSAVHTTNRPLTTASMVRWLRQRVFTHLYLDVSPAVSSTSHLVMHPADTVPVHQKTPILHNRAFVMRDYTMLEGLFDNNSYRQSVVNIRVELV